MPTCLSIVTHNTEYIENCVVDYVESKVVKRFGVLTKETRTSTKPVPRRYLAGLSFGPSSSVLTQLLDNTAKYHASRKASSPFEPLVVHVDTDLSHSADAGDTSAQKVLAKYRERFPNISFECVHLTKVLSIKTIDWSTLPALEGGDDVEKLRRFFDALPSVSSRADILRLFIRHILLHVAIEKSYSALLLAHNTTTLASLTLAEVANGRGFAVPWQVNDGLFTVCTYEQDSEGPSKEVSKIQFPVYYPIREVLKNEIVTYLELIPSLQELIPSPDSTTTSVVSHKDLSIEEVMTRYFDNIEGPQSGIIANVVRITGKLDRPVGSEFCRMCGITLDEDGDSRWAGELGDTEETAGPRQSGKLCYGCKRSING
ncbi:Cytoplasmic tRNA 2-thiolation protein 2 [Cladobotryum mycophilum]|uniref:Cytoplasmic tRNA 2-thiolation protein 2 n=1 Tax=Cladobotryum mycophilum TaxID=491253 RepID=A0ABR0S9M4_9HYPO